MVSVSPHFQSDQSLNNPEVWAVTHVMVDPLSVEIPWLQCCGWLGLTMVYSCDSAKALSSGHQGLHGVKLLSYDRAISI